MLRLLFRSITSFSPPAASGRAERLDVLLLSQAPGIGGGERATVLALASAPGLRITVAAPEPVCLFAEEAGLATIVLDLPWSHRLSQAVPLMAGSIRVRRMARRLEASVIYSNGTRAIPYAIGARVIGGPPVLVHHHGLLSTGPVRSFVAGVKRYSSAIVVPSIGSASPFGDSDKVRIIPNGIDLDRFHPPIDRGNAKQSFGINREAPVIGTVGRAHPGKGMRRFLNLAARLGVLHPEARFLMVGGAAFPSEAGSYESLQRQAEAVMGEHAVLTGVLSDPSPAFQAMDIFMHLGEPEGFGLTIIEALACGVPVVGYRWGGVTEIIDEGLTGFLVEPNEEIRAQHAVTRLLEDHHLRTEMGARGRLICEQRYDVKQFAGELISVVRTIGDS